MCHVVKYLPHPCTHPDCLATMPSRAFHVSCDPVAAANGRWGSCPNPAYETVLMEAPQAEQARSHTRCRACLRRAAPRPSSAGLRAWRGGWFERVVVKREGIKEEEVKKEDVKQEMVKQEAVKKEEEDIKQEGIKPENFN
ncbi:hypothetical protein B0I37DRAFT_408097 [Chaetomium sp. MPI-CAGE-AT-0009]|nr:hypothetical protein B0I37DRAFT_408097 [Chaetomium sp. MPI-CAGE-AT-0009]